MQSTEFTEKLEKAKDLDEVLSMIKEHGIEITKEDLESVTEQFGDGELDENRLEAVAGGRAINAVVAGAAALVAWLKKHPGIIAPSPIRPLW